MKKRQTLFRRFIILLFIFVFLSFLFLFIYHYKVKQKVKKNKLLNDVKIYKEFTKKSFKNFIKNQLHLKFTHNLNNRKITVQDYNNLQNNNNDIPNSFFTIKKEIKKYSSYQFHNSYVYSPGPGGEMIGSSWGLENICFSKDGNFIYFTNEENFETSPVMQHLLYHTNRNNKYLGNLQTLNDINGDNGNFYIKILKKEIPNGENVKWIKKPIILMKRFKINNFRNLLNENLIPIFDLRKRFNILNSTFLFLDELNNETLKNTLQWSFLLNNKEISLQKCSYRTIDNKYIYKIEKYPCPKEDIKNRKDYISYDSLFYKNIQICFKKIYFGIGDRYLSYNKDITKFRELPILKFRNYIYFKLGLKRNRIIKIDFKITFLFEKFNIFGNLLNDSLQNNLKNKLQNYFKNNINFDINIINLEQFNNPIEMINYFSSIDLLISLNGNSSYISSLLSDKTALFLFPICFARKDFVKKLEGFNLSELFLRRGFRCAQPYIHYFTTIPFIQLSDMSPLVKGCKVTNKIDSKTDLIDEIDKRILNIPNEEFLCNELAIDEDILFKEIIHTVLNRIQLDI